MNSIILLYTTLPSKEAALKIAHTLLEKKLIACANITAITSTFRWNEKIELSDEFALLAKTTPEIKETLTREIKALHPYDVPALFFITADAEKNFFNWITHEISNSNKLI